MPHVPGIRTVAVTAGLYRLLPCDRKNDFCEKLINYEIRNGFYRAVPVNAAIEIIWPCLKFSKHGEREIPKPPYFTLFCNFCNLWSSKYCLRNCNATIYVRCEKMFELNGFLWYLTSISALLKKPTGLNVFEQLIYKEVFSKPTSYICSEKNEEKI